MGQPVQSKAAEAYVAFTTRGNRQYRGGINAACRTTPQLW